MRSTAVAWKRLLFEFSLHKEAGLKTPEISDFCSDLRKTLFFIQTFMIYNYNNGKAIFGNETVNPRPMASYMQQNCSALRGSMYYLRFVFPTLSHVSVRKPGNAFHLKMG